MRPVNILLDTIVFESGMSAAFCAFSHAAEDGMEYIQVDKFDCQTMTGRIKRPVNILLLIQVFVGKRSCGSNHCLEGIEIPHTVAQLRGDGPLVGLLQMGGCHHVLRRALGDDLAMAE